MRWFLFSLFTKVASFFDDRPVDTCEIVDGFDELPPHVMREVRRLGEGLDRVLSCVDQGQAIVLCMSLTHRAMSFHGMTECIADIYGVASMEITIDSPSYRSVEVLAEEPCLLN